MANKGLEERTKAGKARYAVALPFVDMDVPEYRRINHKGGSIATTCAGAVSQYIFRMIQHEITARTVLANLRDRYGGAGSYAMRLPEDYKDDENNPLTGNDLKTAEEIELCSYFATCYGRDARAYLDEARRILAEFEKIEKKQKRKK